MGIVPNILAWAKMNNLAFHSLSSQKLWYFMVYHLIPHLLYLERKFFSKQAMPMTKCLERIEMLKLKNLTFR